ncbi:MAG: universal stress protein [Vicinamibacterales bacterium]
MPRSRIPAVRFRSVLCPVDFSEHSRAALRYAAAVVTRSLGRITVLYVNDPLLIAAAAAAYSSSRLARTARAELGRFARTSLRASQAASLRLATAVGKPAIEIDRIARRGRFDLIVMGTHGASGASRLFFGSTTAGVLARARVPVLAIPPRATGRGARPLASWPGRLAIAPIDLDRQAAKHVALAGRVARWFGGRLVLVHVVPRVRAPAWYGGDSVTRQRVHTLRARRELQALQSWAGPGVVRACRVVSGHVADEVAALAAAERAGLIIVGLPRRKGLLAWRPGSTVYHLLCHATMPVLAWPRHRF